jgi:hypothetical protein
MFGGVLCDVWALCESFRVGSSSGSSGGGAVAAAADDFIFDVVAAQTESYVVRFFDGSTQRFGGFAKEFVTIAQLANSVATGSSRIDDGSVAAATTGINRNPLGHQPRLMFGGVLCDVWALCESFRVGSSSGSSGGRAEAAAADDLVFDVVCCPPCVLGRSRCVMHVTHCLLMHASRRHAAFATPTSSISTP